MEPHSKKVILLIEDDKALNRAAVFKFEQRGHTVISTSTAEEAFTVLKDRYNEIDIIWLDILLPGMNGIEFLVLLRKDPRYRDLKTIICSVSGRMDDRELLASLGVSEYIVKSEYSIDNLVEKIANLA